MLIHLFQEVAAVQTTSTTFQLNNANIKCLENMTQGFKRTISWNKFRSEITTQLSSNKLDYLIDPTFRNINCSFLQKC